MQQSRPAIPAAPKRPGIYRLLVVQLGVTLVTAALLTFEADSSLALSALKGGLAGLLPNVYFAWRAFLYRGARFQRQMIRSFYRAQVGKHLLAILLFTGIFVMSPPQSPQWFFVTFALVQCVYWLTPWLIGRPGSH